MGKNFIAGTGFTELNQPHLDNLAKETGEHIRLAAVIDGQLIWVLRAVVSMHGLQYSGTLDTRIVPHITASGKVWLSTLKDEEAVRIVSRWNIEEAREYGGPTAITSIRALLADLDKTRKTGFATVVEEAEIGVCAAAVGVYDTSKPGKLLGTLSLAGPTARLNGQKLKSKIAAMKVTALRVQEAWNLWASENTGGPPAG
jgi:DNA-binding IclR family transcriptional regulator